MSELFQPTNSTATVGRNTGSPHLGNNPSFDPTTGKSPAASPTVGHAPASSPSVGQSQAPSPSVGQAPASSPAPGQAPVPPVVPTVGPAAPVQPTQFQIDPIALASALSNPEDIVLRSRAQALRTLLNNQNANQTQLPIAQPVPGSGQPLISRDQAIQNILDSIRQLAGLIGGQ